MKEAEQPRESSSNHKEAARKAWRTMKRERHEAAARISKRLDDFITVKRITSIQHPEASQRAQTEYGIIIRQFDKTPESIVCGKFWELRWAYGCPLSCAYCYLRGTTRGYMTPRQVKLEYVLGALDEAFSDQNFNNGKPALFNSGELCDSLMFPQVMSKIADKFEEQDRHKLVTLSKLGVENAKFLIQKPRKNTICAWSINSTEAARRWESLAPSPEERVRAATMVADAGYEVRVRIDPIFPIEEWRKSYGDVIEMLLSNVQPKRIILGTPRGLWKTIHYAKEAEMDTSWIKYLDHVETGWGRKLPFHQRKEIYEFMYDRLAALGYNKNQISICKETRDLLDALAIMYKPLTCKCYTD